MRELPRSDYRRLVVTSRWFCSIFSPPYLKSKELLRATPRSYENTAESGIATTGCKHPSTPRRSSKDNLYRLLYHTLRRKAMKAGLLPLLLYSPRPLIHLSPDTRLESKVLAPLLTLSRGSGKNALPDQQTDQTLGRVTKAINHRPKVSALRPTQKGVQRLSYRTGRWASWPICASCQSTRCGVHRHTKPFDFQKRSALACGLVHPFLLFVVSKSGSPVATGILSSLLLRDRVSRKELYDGEEFRWLRSITRGSLAISVEQ